MNWAKDIGPATLAVVKHQLHNRPHPEHGDRSCLGLLNQARGYGRGRLEAACERALAIHSPTDQSVTSILKQGLDKQPLEPSAEGEQATLPRHPNVRGSRYYH